MERSLIILTIFSMVSCKIYNRCDLIKELQKYGAEGNELETWVCIAKYESHFNTSAINTYSGDHGIFQISEHFWCSTGKESKACHLTCDKLKDDDIADDFKCAKKVYKEHKRLQGDGFKAWVVYSTHCNNGRSKGYTDGC